MSSVVTGHFFGNMTLGRGELNETTRMATGSTTGWPATLDVNAKHVGATTRAP
jgi:hypothetical protein